MNDEYVNHSNTNMNEINKKDPFCIDLIFRQFLSINKLFENDLNEREKEIESKENNNNNNNNHNIYSSAIRFYGVYLCVDLVNFTKFISSIQNWSDHEKLQVVDNIKLYFSTLLDIVSKYQGEVVKFTGDGLQIIWQVPMSISHNEQSINVHCRKILRENAHKLTICIQLAISCACEITEKLWDQKISESHILSIRAGISFGELLSIDVYSDQTKNPLGGGYDAENFLLGEPLEEGNQAETMFKIKNLYEGVVCMKKIKSYLLTDQFMHFFHIEDIDSHTNNNNNNNKNNNKNNNDLFIHVKYKIQYINQSQLKKFINSLIQDYLLMCSCDDIHLNHHHHLEAIKRIKDQHSPVNTIDFSSNDLNKFNQHVITVFIKLSINDNDLKYATFNPKREFNELGFITNLEYDEEFMDQTLLRKYQLYFQIIKQNITDKNGYLRQFINDDKGIVAICVFGLSFLKEQDNNIEYSEEPPMKGDQYYNATRSALNIRNELQGYGVSTSIGITSGTCWCGDIGNETRKDILIIGESVNKSARLMAEAREGEILIDETCLNIGKEKKWDISNIREIQIKGFDHIVKIARFNHHKTRKLLTRVDKIDNTLTNVQPLTKKKKSSIH